MDSEGVARAARRMQELMGEIRCNGSIGFNDEYLAAIIIEELSRPVAGERPRHPDDIALDALCKRANGGDSGAEKP